MGWYTCFLIAERDDAKAIADVGDDHLRYNRWPHVWMKHVGDAELNSIWSAIRGNDRSRNGHGDLIFTKVSNAKQDPALVYELPPEFVSDLAGSTADELPRVANAWGGTEEFIGSDTEELVEVIATLAEFAREAVAAGKPILHVPVL